MALAHSWFNVERLYVLPSFFQERNEEINAHVQVSSDIVFSHIDSGDSGTQAKDFFELKSKE